MSKWKDRDWLALDKVRRRLSDGTYVFESYAEQCERKQPTRPLSVLAYIDLAIDAPPQHQPSNRGSTRKSNGRRMGPKRTAERERLRESRARPDERELEVQRAKHRLGRAIREAGPDKSLAEGLRIFAEDLAPRIQVEAGLLGEEHRAAITEFLIGCWGLTAENFPAELYLQWREQTRLRLVA